VERAIRHTGAGAVLAAGIITLCRTILTIVSSLRESMKDFSAGKAGATVRTERDLPLTVVLGGSLALAISWPSPPMLTQGNFRLAAAAGVRLLRHRVVADHRVDRSSPNPIGMTIATLILTCGIFVALRSKTPSTLVAICVGAIVCIGGERRRDVAGSQDRSWSARRRSISRSG
jgi:hypothetical protein